LWDPRCRTSSKPSDPRIAITSLGFRAGNRVIRSGRHGLGPDEFSLQTGFAVLQEHANHFPQVLIELVEAGPLTMGTRKPGNVSNKKAGLWISFDDGCERPHCIPSMDWVSSLSIIPSSLPLEPASLSGPVGRCLPTSRPLPERPIGRDPEPPFWPRRTCSSARRGARAEGEPRHDRCLPR
jgi:hypothetical protein